MNAGVPIVLVGVMLFVLAFYPTFRVIYPPEEYLEPVSFMGMGSDVPEYEVRIWLDDYRDVAGEFDNYDFTCINPSCNFTIKMYANWILIWGGDFWWDENFTYTKRLRSDRPIELDFVLPVKERKVNVKMYVDPRYHHITIEQYWFRSLVDVGAVYGKISPDLENAVITFCYPSNLIIEYENGEKFYKFTDTMIESGMNFVKRENVMYSNVIGTPTWILPHSGIGSVENFGLEFTETKFSISGSWFVDNGKIQIRCLVEDNDCVKKKFDNKIMISYDEYGYLCGLFEEDNEAVGWIYCVPFWATVVCIYTELPGGFGGETGVNVWMLLAGIALGFVGGIVTAREEKWRGSWRERI